MDIARQQHQHRGFLLFAAVLLCSGLSSAVTMAGDCEFVRGQINDLDGMDVVDLNDLSDLLAVLFLGRSLPECVDAADINDNGLVEISDHTYLFRYLLDEGPPPPSPFAASGTDPTPDVTVSDTPDDRFEFTIGASGAGVPSNTGIQIPLLLSNSEPITGLQMILGYNRRDPNCPDLLVQEIRTEENTLLSQESCEYIVAEFDNLEGVAYVAALKDAVDPVDQDPFLPAGDDQLIATLVVAISSCANMGFSPLGFEDGLPLTPRDSVAKELLPAAHNLVALGTNVVRPVLGQGSGIDIRRGFIRGDVNKDDSPNIADVIYLLDWLFRGGRPPPCLDAADVNNDTGPDNARGIDLADPVWLLAFLFRGGPQPSEPYPQAGVDPSDDGSGSMGCASDM